MKQWILVGASFFLIASLTGCKDQVPKCSDDSTIDLVKKIVAEQIGNAAEVDKLKAQFDVRLPRASSFNETIKKYECEARLVSGGTVELPITYESQIDDGGQHIVAVGGIQRGDLFQVLAAAAAQIKQADETAARAREAVAAAQAQQAANNAAKARAAAAAAAPRPQPAPPAPVSTLPAAAPAAPSPANAAAAGQPGRATTAPVQNAKPSFDCGRATTLVENTICSDGQLASLDALLARSYAQMTAADVGDGARAALKADQRAWISRRNQCSSKSCLEAIYQSRIDEVCGIPVVSGVHPDCGAGTSGQQAEQTPASAAKQPVPNDVPTPVQSFMEKSYGQFDAKHACWRTTYEEQAYCMKVVRMDRITADTGERFYLLAGGQPLDEDGEPESVHALSGLVGAFVFEIHPTETELVASNKSMYVGGSGIVPEHWELVKLATTGYYGWRTTWGDCHMGYCGSRLTILAPFGKSVKDVAAFNISYTDDGACDEQRCPDGKSSVESTVTIDASATDSEIHPLLVAFKGKMAGRNLAGTSRRLDFDRKAWRYSVPDDWPLAGVEY